MNEQKYCAFCGNELKPGWQFCENCGRQVPVHSAPVVPVAPPPMPPQPVYQSTPQAPPQATPQPVQKKQTKSLLLPVLGLGCLGLICVGVLVVAGWFFYLANRDAGIAQAPAPVSATSLPVDMPTAEIVVPTEAVPAEPVATEPAAQPTAQPPQETPTEAVAPPLSQDVVSVQQSFTRWPLDYSLAWEYGENDVYMTDINQDHSWIIGLKKPDSLVMVIPPDPLAYYPQHVSISAKVKPGDPASSGPYGLICHFRDENNYYVLEIQGDSFGIGKMENGRFTPLTEPYWQKSQSIAERDQNGYIEVTFSCVEYLLGVSINGLAEIYPVYDVDESFSGGAAAFWGASGQQAVDMLMGIFYFKDLTIEEIVY